MGQIIRDGRLGQACHDERNQVIGVRLQEFRQSWAIDGHATELLAAWHNESPQFSNITVVQFGCF
ncbi:MAG: hypothetical protein AAF745_11755 [Planctomycetota bacterium]